MPHFRMQHYRGGRSGAITLIRAVGLTMVLLLLLALGVYWFRNLPPDPSGWAPAEPAQRYFLPAGGDAAKVVHYPEYTAAFDSSGAILWAACEYDARMTYSWAFPDSLFSRLRQADLILWREWLQKGRQAALRLGKLYAVAGPVHSDEKHFIVWLDEGVQRLEGVGVIFPDCEPVSIDSVETLTGLDFFQEYWLDSLENEVEKSLNLAHWAPEVR